MVLPTDVIRMADRYAASSRRYEAAYRLGEFMDHDFVYWDRAAERQRAALARLTYALMRQA